MKDQEEELDELASQVQLLEQAKLRLEMNVESMRKEAKKEANLRDEEMEEMRGNAQKRVKGEWFTSMLIFLEIYISLHVDWLVLYSISIATFHTSWANSPLAMISSKKFFAYNLNIDWILSI